MNDSRPAYVDAHCHLDLYPDLAAQIGSCDSSAVATLAVTTTPRAWPKNRELAQSSPFVTPALGFHPHLVGERIEELEVWDRFLPEADFVGEVGLDASPRFFSSLPTQKEVFAHVLRACSSATAKVLTVHSVRTARQVLDMIEASSLLDNSCAVILHWFTGSASEAQRAVELGCHFSVNLEMLAKDFHQKTIQLIPAERLLTETDGPFTQVSGRSSRPEDVRITVRQLAAVRGVDEEELRQTIVDNFASLTNLNCPMAGDKPTQLPRI
jgi:TatD DNase family protein